MKIKVIITTEVEYEVEGEISADVGLTRVLAFRSRPEATGDDSVVQTSEKVVLATAEAVDE